MTFKAALASQWRSSCPYMALSFQTLRQPQFLSNFQSLQFKFLYRRKMFLCLMLWQKHQYFLKKTYLDLIATVPKNHSYFFDVLPRRKMKLKLPKNVFYKNCKPKLIFFRIRKIWMCFDIENWLWMSKFHDSWPHCAISALQILKKHLWFPVFYKDLIKNYFKF